jgi:hypothetical protein
MRPGARVPNHVLVYKQLDEQGQPRLLVLPIEGKGLWSTMYGFLALEADLTTVRGLTFYEHGETPGSRRRVDNPRWKALWPGREAFDESRRCGDRGGARPAGRRETDPYRVDGLSGATITEPRRDGRCFGSGSASRATARTWSAEEGGARWQAHDDVLLDPLFNNNPIALQVLGICSALAVTTKMETSLVMASPCLRAVVARTCSSACCATTSRPASASSCS